LAEPGVFVPPGSSENFCEVPPGAGKGTGIQTSPGVGRESPSANCVASFVSHDIAAFGDSGPNFSPVRDTGYARMARPGDAYRLGVADRDITARSAFRAAYCR
jgi:hypothetical protein